MRVVYLLEGSALFGGVKVVLQHVRALRQLGVDAVAVSPEPPPVWFGEVAELYRQLPSLQPEAIGPAEIAVGTMWHTVRVAEQIPGALAAHFCQCYEPLYEGIRPQWEEIESVYRLPTLKLAASPHLAELVEQRTGQPCCWVPQPFDTEAFHPPPQERRGDTFRVLIAGQFDLDIKGVAWAMEALRPLAEEKPRLELVRLAQDAPDTELALWPDAERHVQVPPDTVPEILRSIDLYVGPSSEVEGFGLPMLESMGCGRPAVLTDIGATRSLDPAGEASLKVPYRDGAALAAAVRQIRDAPSLARRLGRAGREIACTFSEGRTGRALLALYSAAIGRR